MYDQLFAETLKTADMEVTEKTNLGYTSGVVRQVQENGLPVYIN